MINQQYEKLIDDWIDLAIREDIGDGDHSSLSCIPDTAIGKAHLLIKEEGILAGVQMARRVFKRFDPELSLHVFLDDAYKVKPGDIAFVVEGKSLSILQCERLVLNIMQRMSGIATQTARYADQLKGLPTKVLDTRKTTPGMRLVEKEAVRLGGGANHRMGLYDMVMLKDNHLDFAGGIEKAIQKTRKYLAEKHLDLKIEVEARNLAEVREIMRVGGIHRIMLDNFSFADTREAVELIGGRVETESSGGITLESLRAYAECGVDFISVGALTHQIKSLDMSLKAF